MSSKQKLSLSLIVLSLTAFICLYGPYITINFWGDDFIWLYEASVQSVLGLFRPGNFFFVRPMSNLFWLLAWHLSGLSPLASHVMLLVGHILCAAALARLAYYISRDWVLPAFCFTMLLTRNATNQTITWPAAVGDLLVGLFLLTTLICLIEYQQKRQKLWLAAACFSALLTAFSKESSVCLLPALLLCQWGCFLGKRQIQEQASAPQNPESEPDSSAPAKLDIKSQPQSGGDWSWSWTLAIAASLGLGLFIEWLAVGCKFVNSCSPGHNFLLIWGNYLFRALWSAQSGGALEGLAEDWQILSAVALWLGVTLSAWFTKRRAIALVSLWLPFSVWPYAWLVPENPVAQRYFYLSALGFSLWVSLIVYELAVVVANKRPWPQVEGETEASAGQAGGNVASACQAGGTATSAGQAGGTATSACQAGGTATSTCQAGGNVDSASPVRPWQLGMEIFILILLAITGLNLANSELALMDNVRQVPQKEFISAQELKSQPLKFPIYTDSPNTQEPYSRYALALGLQCPVDQVKSWHDLLSVGKLAPEQRAIFYDPYLQSFIDVSPTIRRNLQIMTTQRRLPLQPGIDPSSVDGVPMISQSPEGKGWQLETVEPSRDFPNTIHMLVSPPFDIVPLAVSRIVVEIKVGDSDPTKSFFLRWRGDDQPFDRYKTNVGFSVSPNGDTIVPSYFVPEEHLDWQRFQRINQLALAWEGAPQDLPVHNIMIYGYPAH